MVPNYQLPKSYLHLNNFCHLFINQIESLILRDIVYYQIEDKQIDKTTNRLFYHHIIHQLCELSRKHRNDYNRLIVYVNISQLQTSLLFSYFTEDDVRNLCVAVLKKASRFLPIRIYFSNYTFDHYVWLLGRNDGRAIETTQHLLQLGEKEFDSFRFDKIKTFTKNYGLNYLNKSYFTGIKSKTLAIS